MMKYLIVLFLLFVKFPAFAQKTYGYYNCNQFKGKSIVFAEEYTPRFLLSDIKGRFTPSKQELDSAEVIFTERYNYDWQDRKQSFVAPVKNVTKEYEHYKRQYLGLINSVGEKVILCQMLNFKRKLNPNYKYEGWENEFIMGFGTFYEKNTIRFIINLSTRRISLW